MVQDWDLNKEEEYKNSHEYKNHLKVREWAEKGKCIACGGDLTRKMWTDSHGGKSERIDCADCPSTFFTHDYLKFRDVIMGKPGARLGKS